MSGPGELAVLTGAIVDAGLKATVVVGAGALVARMLRRRSAAVRHAVWGVTLAALPVLPVVAHQRAGDVAIDAPWLLGVWLAGVLVALAPFVRGVVWLRRHVPPAAAGTVWSTAVQTPATWGFLRPTVIMPAHARAWEPAWQQAALAHERAHVRRGDWLVHVGAQVVASLFWFHPLVWLARRRLALEAEHAADDAVLATGVRPSTYAALLVHMARRRSPRPPLGTLGAGSPVGRRVRAILGDGDRSARRTVPLVGLALLAIGLAPVVGAWPAWTSAPSSITCFPEATP